jgi:hypothetical protein
MKSFPVKLGVILVAIGFTIFYHGEVRGEDWRLYGQDGFANYYYDAEKIIRPSKTIVRVWGKVIYTKEGVTGLTTRLGKEFRTLNFSIDLYEFNCANREHKELQRTFFSQRATYLGEQSDLSWGYISDGSIQEKLWEIICKSIREDVEPIKSKPSR